MTHGRWRDWELYHENPADERHPDPPGPLVKQQVIRHHSFLPRLQAVLYEGKSTDPFHVLNTDSHGTPCSVPQLPPAGWMWADQAEVIPRCPAPLASSPAGPRALLWAPTLPAAGVHATTLLDAEIQSEVFIAHSYGRPLQCHSTTEQRS
ncbi:hypothetical protein AAFF_G00156680 [Aldrovandia affinis]|uniref:Uncharacterized protein n=1 Tax=Aldrovandia affinis TaxID=143900 RepID=A0AAD7RNQ3_9TELE|nr:hypothetical protein AAFF_G00156680 [Aldrovandia affinis]